MLQLHTVAAAVGRHLLDHHRRLARAAGPDAALFASLALDAVEAKLESVKQQVGVGGYLNGRACVCSSSW